MRIIDNAITTLVGEESRSNRLKGILAAPNGSLYGIPFSARRVVKFNPIDKSMTHIGPDFGDGKWHNGAMTDNGVIYCPPSDSHRRGILKIDTKNDTATELDANLLPQQGGGMWMSCAVALDGCIYFMPWNAHRIMKLDPNNNDTISSVGYDLGEGLRKYIGTVVGIDGCVYGIPYHSSRILKYDPINDIISFVGERIIAYFNCTGGALGRDGFIYAIQDSRVLKIDTTNNSHCFVGRSMDGNHRRGRGWLDGILGIDGCIYWPPMDACRTLKYDPHSNQTSLVGRDFGIQRMKWITGALAADGVIYCIPSTASTARKILAIDPLREFSDLMKTHMEEHPEELGFLFRINDTDTASNRTYFDCAVTKFGMQQVLEIVQEHLPPANEVCAVCGLYPFMIAASCQESSLSVIYLLLRQVPFLINRKSNSAVENTNDLKRKRNIEDTI